MILKIFTDEEIDNLDNGQVVDFFPDITSLISDRGIYWDGF